MREPLKASQSAFPDFGAGMFFSGAIKQENPFREQGRIKIENDADLGWSRGVDPLLRGIGRGMRAGSRGLDIPMPSRYNYYR